MAALILLIFGLVWLRRLQPRGYGVVAVDALGYAGSSKPTDSASYAVRLMAGDLCEILDVEGS